VVPTLLQYGDNLDVLMLWSNIEIYFYTITGKENSISGGKYLILYAGLCREYGYCVGDRQKNIQLRNSVTFVFLRTGKIRSYMLAVTNRLLPDRLRSAALDSIQTDCSLQSCFLWLIFTQLMKFRACVESGDLSPYYLQSATKIYYS
jgi:hypothetical protein